MSRAFIAFYMGDYAKDTQTLTTVEHGAYFLLLIQCWVHGFIPSEPAKRAKIAKLPLREWKKIATTIDPFFDAEGRNKRATKEIEKADEARFKRGIAGRKGGFASGRSKAIDQGKRSNAEAGLQLSYSNAESLAEAKVVAKSKQCVANQRSKIITTTTSVAAREVPLVENSGSNADALPAGFAEKARQAVQQNPGKSHLVDALERKGKHR